MTGLTPVPLVALKSWIAPAIDPWSVSETAGISNSAARAASAGTRQAPSRIEYSEWTWRWTNGASGTGGNSRVASGPHPFALGTPRMPATSWSQREREERGQDQHPERDRPEREQPGRPGNPEVGQVV